MKVDLKQDGGRKLKGAIAAAGEFIRGFVTRVREAVAAARPAGTTRAGEGEAAARPAGTARTDEAVETTRPAGGPRDGEAVETTRPAGGPRDGEAVATARPAGTARDGEGEAAAGPAGEAQADETVETARPAGAARDGEGEAAARPAGEARGQRLREAAEALADAALDRIPPGARRPLILGLGGTVAGLIVLVAILLVVDVTGGAADPLAEGDGGPTIPVEELFLPAEPDYVPELLRESEPGGAWTAEDAAPFWRSLSREFTDRADWRAEAGAAVSGVIDELLEGVP